METGRTQLTVEELSARIAPSTLTFRTFTGATPTDTQIIAYSPPAHTGYRVFANRPLLPEGTASGTYSGPNGGTLTLSGTADLFGIGTINLSGSVSTTGSNPGQASGSLLLTSSEGSISLSLSATSSSGRGQLPAEMVFTVNSASGEFLHVGGSGIIKLSTSASSGSTGNFSISMT